jgi:ankyrin repeat protein
VIYYINHQDSYSAPLHKHPLHLAAYFNLPWLVDFYISQDRNTIHSVCTTNDTPLIWASEMGSTGCVRKLLEAGADPNQVEIDGWSALHWAARKGHPEVAQLLLESGARLCDRPEGPCQYAREIAEGTPLDWALETGNWKVAKILKQWEVKELNSGFKIV